MSYGRNGIHGRGYRRRGKALKERLFNQEFMASPVYSENSFITPQMLNQAINPNLQPQTSYKGVENVYAGYDIGKKTHPSHIAVFREKDGHYTQLGSWWMDKWDYTDQIELVESLIERFRIDVVAYDATRGELEALSEQGRLPPQMKPVHFTNKTRHAMATAMEAVFSDGKIELLDESRQSSQILAVSSDLVAVESPEGHGDSFWSIALVFWCLAHQPSVVILN